MSNYDRPVNWWFDIRTLCYEAQCDIPGVVACTVTAMDRADSPDYYESLMMAARAARCQADEYVS